MCVSIGVMVGKRIRCGVIHAPLLNETYHTIAGRGSYVTSVLPPYYASKAGPASALSLGAATSDQSVMKLVPPCPVYAAAAPAPAAASSATSEAEAPLLVSFPSAAKPSAALAGESTSLALVGPTQRLAVSGQTKLEKCALICEFGYGILYLWCRRERVGCELSCRVLSGE